MDKYQPEEEHPRPEYIARLHGVEEKTVNFVTQTTEPRVPFWSRKFPGWLVPLVEYHFILALALDCYLMVCLYVNRSPIIRQ